MARILLGLALVVVIVTVYAVVDCAMMQAERVRGLPKPAWLVVILLVPVIGVVLWFVIGRAPAGYRPAPRPTAPDDDQRFLGSISKAEQDERIRRLEEELAALDDEFPGTPAAPTTPEPDAGPAAPPRAEGPSTPGSAPGSTPGSTPGTTPGTPDPRSDSRDD